MTHLFKKIFLAFLIFGIFSCNDSATTTNTKTESTTTQESTTKTTSKKKKQILFFGDSITAGYGLEDPSKSYVGFIQQKLDSLNMNYQTVSAGVSGETSSGGNDRIDWILENNTIDVFILELGANDGLRGIPTEETTKNLKSIFDKVKTKFPDAKLVVAGMYAPPNMGDDFNKKFAAIFSKLAKSYNAALVPFLLDGVAGIPELNQRDRIHPTSKGHEILADNVWTVLQKVL